MLWWDTRRPTVDGSILLLVLQGPFPRSGGEKKGAEMGKHVTLVVANQSDQKTAPLREGSFRKSNGYLIMPSTKPESERSKCNFSFLGNIVHCFYSNRTSQVLAHDLVTPCPSYRAGVDNLRNSQQHVWRSGRILSNCIVVVRGQMVHVGTLLRLVMDFEVVLEAVKKLFRRTSTTG